MTKEIELKILEIGCISSAKIAEERIIKILALRKVEMLAVSTEVANKLEFLRWILGMSNGMLAAHMGFKFEDLQIIENKIIKEITENLYK